MATKLRNLRLISSEADTGTGRQQAASVSDFALVSVGELSTAEQRLVDKIVTQAAPGAGLIAVARTLHAWDLRPVVMKAGDAEPSVIRLTAPLGSNNQEVIHRLQSNLDQVALALAGSLSSFTWGKIDGQIWARRTLHHSTLAQQLSVIEWSGERVLSFFQQVLEQVLSLHAYGVVHGNVSTNNIALDADGAPLLLDSCFAIAQLQSGISRDLSLASELAQSPDQLLPSADVFGLGQVCKRICIKAQRRIFEQGTGEELLFDALNERIEPMLAHAPQARPHLHEVLARFRELQGSAHPVSAPNETQAEVRTRNAEVQSISRPAQSQYQDHSPQPVPQQISESSTALPAKTHAVVPEAKSMWWVYTIALLSLCFCAWTVYQRYDVATLEEEIDTAGLRSAWSSGLPSQMQPVVALAAKHPHSLAEQLVLRSALKGEKMPRGINSDLLQIAFDSRWEAALSASDRRAAMILATAGFVRHSDRSPLAQLAELHAGVQFAITATAPSSAKASLENIPAERLLTLPAPLDQAFAEVVVPNKSTSADAEVRSLARFAAFGVPSPAEVVLFLEDDFDMRLKALARVFAGDERSSTAIIDAVLNHPNSEFSEANVPWAKKWNLTAWEVPEATKLELLAGITPRTQLEASYVAALFGHPSATLRQFAVSSARDRIAFSHPGSLKVLSMVANEPKLLTAEQLMPLAKILEDPKKISASELTEWTATQPAVSILESMLIATADEDSSHLVDTFIAMQLSEQQWQPSEVQIKKLISHPNDYTRMMVYQKVFSQGTESSVELLQQAARTESNKAYQSQLALMLEQLHATLNP